MKCCLTCAFCLALAIAGCSPVPGYCQAQGDCNKLEARLFDFVGESDDSVNVCEADNEGLVRTLRANKERECQDEADAFEAYMACASDAYAKDNKDPCAPFIPDDNNPCSKELDDFTHASQNAGDVCDPNQT